MTIKDVIRSIGSFNEETTPILEHMRLWMLITGLEFKDVVHLSYHELVNGLNRVAAKLKDSLDIFDEDQLQEAACRCLKKITIYGDLIEEGEVALHHGQILDWDGFTWNYISDPKLRQRETSKSYLEAREAVRESLGL